MGIYGTVKRYVFVALVGLTGAILSVAAFRTMLDLEKIRLESVFERHAYDQAVLISQKIEDQYDIILSLSNFYAGSKSVERDEFRAFTEPILKRHPEILALDWIAVVKDAERQSYEDAVKQGGIPEFEIKEAVARGKFIKAPSREEYYPICYSEPSVSNAQIIGFDVGTDLERKKILQSARDDGLPKAGSTWKPFRLLEDKDAFFILLPIYRNDAPRAALEDRRKNILGYLHMISLVSSIAEASLGKLKHTGIDIYLYDMTPGAQEDVIYFHPSYSYKKEPPPLFKADIFSAESPVFSYEFWFVDRKWAIKCMPASGYYLPNYWASFGVLAVGFILTSLLIAYMTGLLKYSRTIEAQIKKRTAELVTANTALQVEVADRMNAELELERSNTYLDKIINSVPDMIFVKDRKLRTILCNEAFARAVGKHPSDLYGKNDIENGWFPELVKGNPEKGIRGFEQDDREALSGKTVHNPNDPANVGKEILIFDTIKLPLRSSQGDIMGVLGVARDITDYRRSEEKLVSAMKELERSNRELEHFAYIASHDLQEPLRMVVSYMQLIEKRYKDRLDSDADEFINFAVDGAKRMQELIDDLLTYSRVGSRPVEFNLVNCNEVVKEAMMNLKVMIEKDQASVTSDPLPVITGDKTQLLQLFQNLISNGIKFHGNRPGKVRISCISEKKEWVFSVRDNGIGIDPKDHESVFLIFKRLHGRGEYSGTGIGLAVCRKVVERHGGRIWIESKAGEGATFYFTIPSR